MRVIVKFLAWAISTCIVVASTWLGSRVSFEEQWPMYEALRTTASIIFAVVGAWIAIVYPERIRLSFSKGSGKEDSGKGLSKLFSPIVHSTTILCIILIIGVVAPLLKTIDALIEHVVVLRGLSYGTLVTLTLWQLWTVILTLVPADIIKAKVDQEEEHKELVSEYTKSSSKQD